MQGKLLYMLVTSETSFLSQPTLDEGKIGVSWKILMERVEKEKRHFDGGMSSCRKYHLSRSQGSVAPLHEISEEALIEWRLVWHLTTSWLNEEARSSCLIAYAST